MLQKINQGGVVSDKGFSVQIVGPEILEYKNKGNILKIGLGYDPKKKKIYIYASEITCWNICVDEENITDAEKDEIIKNIKDAVKLLTGDFEIV